MQNFCTLYNSFYLSRGLAMYNSLLDQTADFHLYIYAFDDACYRILTRLKLSNATIIPLHEFETGELLAIKDSRTAGEYCWTCTPSILWHCIPTYNLDHCTYVDADLMFFSNPIVLTQEMGSKSVLITEHRYSADYDQSALSGIYCVQFLTVKNTPEGLRVLDWWRKACLMWCYNRFEDGKFGDQKYLDDWTTRFEEVHVLKHLGGGLAPWNAKEYQFGKAEGKAWIKIDLSEKTALIFYHFHDFRYCADDVFRLTAEQYFLPKDVVRIIYAPYSRVLRTAEIQIKQTDHSAVFNEAALALKWIQISLSRRIRFMLQGYYKNYYKKHKL